MEEKTFSTFSDYKYSRRRTIIELLITYIIFTLLACLGFLIDWATFLFFEVCIIASLSIWPHRLRTDRGWKLEFVDDNLTVINLYTRESFAVYDISASDLIIKQTKKEKQLDYCDLKIKNTIFNIRGIRKCEELKKYIKENYS